MSQILLLEEIAIIAAASVLVTVALGRMKLPTAAGLLFSGALLGPHGLKLASDVHAIETIAEVGVVFLLFTIGLEFSLGRLKHIFRRVALGGILQVGVTILTVAYVAQYWGYPLGEALFYGFVFALSSTALVLRELSERQELDAPHGRFIVGTLIFQDLCVVPMVLMVPLLGEVGEGGAAFAEMGYALGKAALVVVGLMTCSRLVAPRVLSWVAASGSREVFILAVLSLCIGTAWLTSLAGLSLALGAFLGGMVVADTEYSHRAMSDILLLRDVFVSFFFVSLGMFFDISVVMEHGTEVALFLAAFIIGKGFIATLAALAMRFPPRAAWLAGAGLAQFGEFGFVLVQIATQEGVVDEQSIQPLLIAGILSMFLTPLLVYKAPHITAGERVLGPLARLLRARSIDQLDTVQPGMKDHVVVIGYGLAGELVTRALHNVELEHVVLEMNAENVSAGRERGHPVYYADATSAEALGHAHVGDARAVIVMINDPSATRRVVDAISRLVPDIPVFVRTEYLGQAEGFLELGASDVVASEVEGGLEVLARVLRELEVPRNVLESEVDKARRRTQRSARQFVVPRRKLGHHGSLSDLKVESVSVMEGSPAVNQSPRTLDLARQSGALMVALSREGKLLTADLADQPLQAEDVVYLIGDLTAVGAAAKILGSHV